VAQQKLDRRVQRTHQLLHKALIELVMEKPYEQITVQDILDRANIGRATFYAHFTDKDDLLLHGLGDEQFDIRHYLDEEELAVDEDKLLPTYAIFRHAQQVHPLYKAILGSQGVEIVRLVFHKHLIHMAEQRLKHHAPALSLPVPVVAHYLAGALMMLMMWWLDHDMPHSPEEMDTMVQQLAMGGLERLTHE
jgi:AcrR family transcriptional regulator